MYPGQGLKQAYSLSFACAGKIMGTSVQQIDALLTVRAENEHLEFKAAENRYGFEELVDYCVALANEGGRRIILGVTDKTPRIFRIRRQFSNTHQGRISVARIIF